MKMLIIIFTLVLTVFVLAGQFGTIHADNKKKKTGPMPDNARKAIFAGGCFWCMQPPFDKREGVISTTVGYAGGTRENPTYEAVSSGKTRHAEAVEVIYDPDRISYAELLDIFWRNIDPTSPNRQFADAGPQYRTAIFYHDETQKQQAGASADALRKSGKYGDSPIVTEIVPATPFYRAEEYHQKYYQKNPFRYKLYRRGSGRDQYLKGVWGDTD
ncbi:peptide-methionine (S)-S-oxide reductase [Desulfonema ishimotonii]|uniref:Peptide methionine sulfoxide reductase MsrA n=1 Tax=Desulfonema ishimotonii TaxID=45657 RepID=A0A401G3N4_9BACT|nr:peptide-methionine (S)-S-oxide reductase MsrA [Desulfonema ishimotonii]GBC63849.1 peptide-methionine (S)-S-oxide reductase [Desulfonema ishimotonii]